MPSLRAVEDKRVGGLAREKREGRGLCERVYNVKFKYTSILRFKPVAYVG